MVKNYVKQLFVVLKKNFLLKRRRPGLLAFEFLWPIGMFLVIYAMRQVTHNPLTNGVPSACHHAPLALPSAGVIPFIQSLACDGIQQCYMESQNVPMYNDSKMSKLSQKLNPVIRNRKKRQVVQEIGTSMNFLQDVLSRLDKPEIRQILERNLTLGSFLRNPASFKNYVVNELNAISPETVDAIYASNINTGNLLRILGATECNPNDLANFFVIPKDEGFPTSNDIGTELCGINFEMRSMILNRLADNVDTDELVKLASSALEVMGNDDLARSVLKLKQMFVLVQNSPELRDIQSFMTEMNKYGNILPDFIKIIEAARNSEINFNLLENAFSDLGPIFGEISTSDVNSVSGLFNYGDDLFKWIRYNFDLDKDVNVKFSDIFDSANKVKELFESRSTLTPNQFTTLMEQMITDDFVQKALKVRTGDDLEDLVCKNNSMLSHELMSSFIEIQQSLCESSQPQLWRDLVQNLNLGGLIEEKMNQDERNDYRQQSLTDLDNRRVRRQTSLDIEPFTNFTAVTSGLPTSIMENFRFEPVVNFIRATSNMTTAAEQTNAAATALYSTAFGFLEGTVGDTDLWKQIMTNMNIQSTSIKFLTGFLDSMTVKRLTFGNMFNRDVTMDEFIQFWIERLPVYMVADMTSDFSERMKQILSSNDPATVRNAYCGAEYTNLVNIPPELDSRKVREVNDALCNFNATLLQEQLVRVYNFDKLQSDIEKVIEKPTVIKDLSVETVIQSDYQTALGNTIKRWEDKSKTIDVDWDALSRVTERRLNADSFSEDLRPERIINSLFNSLPNIDRGMADQLEDVLRFMKAINSELGNQMDQNRITNPRGQLVYYLTLYGPYLNEMFIDTMASPALVDRLVKMPKIMSKDFFCGAEWKNNVYVPNLPPRLSWNELQTFACSLNDTYFRQLEQAIELSPEMKNFLEKSNNQQNRMVDNVQEDKWTSTLSTDYTNVVKEISDKMESIPHDKTLIMNIDVTEYRERQLSDSIGRLKQQFESGDVKYYANLYALMIRSSQETAEDPNQQMDSINSQAVEKVTLSDYLHGYLVELNRRLEASQGDLNLKNFFPNENVLRQAVSMILPLSIDAVTEFQNFIFNPLQLIEAVQYAETPKECSEIILNDYFISMPAQQVNDFAQFFCANQKQIEKEVGDINNRLRDEMKGKTITPRDTATELSKLGSNLQTIIDRANQRDKNIIFADVPQFDINRLETALNNLGNSLGNVQYDVLIAQILDSQQSALDDELTKGPVSGVWSLFKIAMLFTAGQSKEQADYYQRYIQYSGQQVTTDQMINPSQATIWRNLQSIAIDGPELLMNALTNNAENMMEVLQNVKTANNLVCNSPTWLSAFPEISGNSNISSSELRRKLCNMESDVRKMSDQYLDANPELYSAITWIDELTKGKMTWKETMKINFTRAVTQVRETNRLQDQSMSLAPPKLNNDKLFNEQQWNQWLEGLASMPHNSDFAPVKFAGDFLVGESWLTAVVPAISYSLTELNIAKQSPDLLKFLGFSNYFVSSFSERIAQENVDSVSLDDMLKKYPNLNKALHTVTDNVVDATSVLLFSVMENERLYQSLNQSSSISSWFTDTVCTNEGYNQYFMVPPYAPNISLRQMFNSLCSVNFTAAGVDFVKFSDPSVADPEAEFQRLNQQFAQVEKYDFNQLVSNASKLINEVTNARDRNPQFFNTFDMRWTEDSTWDDVISNFAKSLEGKDFYYVLKPLVPYVDSLLGLQGANKDLSFMFLRPYQLQLQDLIDQAKKNRINDITISAYCPQSEELQKLNPIEQDGVQIVATFLATTANQAKMTELFERVSKEGFCALSASDIESYLVVPQNIQVDVARYHQIICSVDAGKLGEQLSECSQHNKYESYLNQIGEIEGGRANVNGITLSQMIDQAEEVKSEFDLTIKQAESEVEITYFGSTTAEWEATLKSTVETYYQTQDPQSDSFWQELQNKLKPIVDSVDKNVEGMNMDVFKGLDHMLAIANRKLVSVENDRIISLDNLFPNSPTIRRGLQLIFETLPAYVALSLPSEANFMAAQKIQDAFGNSTKEKLCSENAMKLEDIVGDVDTGLTSEDWQKLQTSICFLDDNQDNFQKEVDFFIDQPTLEQKLSSNNAVSFKSLMGNFEELQKNIQNIQNRNAKLELPGEILDPKVWEDVVKRWSDSMEAYNDVQNDLARYEQLLYDQPDIDPDIKNLVGNLQTMLRSVDDTLTGLSARSVSLDDLVPAKYSNLRKMSRAAIKSAPRLYTTLSEMKETELRNFEALTENPQNFYNTKCAESTGQSEPVQFICNWLLNDANTELIGKELTDFLGISPDVSMNTDYPIANITDNIVKKIQHLIESPPNIVVSEGTKVDYESTFDQITKQLESADFNSLKKLIKSLQDTLKSMNPNYKDTEEWKAFYPIIAAMESLPDDVIAGSTNTDQRMRDFIEGSDNQIPNLFNTGNSQSDIDKLGNSFKQTVDHIIDILGGEDQSRVQLYEQTMNLLPILMTKDAIKATGQNSNQTLQLNDVIITKYGFNLVTWLSRFADISEQAATDFNLATIRIQPLLEHGNRVICENGQFSSVITYVNGDSRAELERIICDARYPQTLDSMALYMDYVKMYQEIDGTSGTRVVAREQPLNSRSKSQEITAQLMQIKELKSLLNELNSTGFLNEDRINEFSRKFEDLMNDPSASTLKDNLNKAFQIMVTLTPTRDESSDLSDGMNRFAKSISDILQTMNRRAVSLRNGTLTVKLLIGNSTNFENELRNSYGFDDVQVDMLGTAQLKLEAINAISSESCSSSNFDLFKFDSKYSQSQIENLVSKICSNEKILESIITQMDGYALVKQVDRIWTSNTGNLPKANWSLILDQMSKLSDNMEYLFENPPKINSDLQNTIEEVVNGPSLLNNSPEFLSNPKILKLALNLLKSFPEEFYNGIEHQLVLLNLLSKNQNEQLKPLVNVGYTFKTMVANGQQTRDLMDKLVNGVEVTVRQLLEMQLDALSAHLDSIPENDEGRLEQVVCDPEFLRAAWKSVELGGLAGQIDSLSTQMCNSAKTTWYDVILQISNSRVQTSILLQRIIDHVSIGVFNIGLKVDIDSLVDNVKDYEVTLGKLRGDQSWVNAVREVSTLINNLDTDTLDYIQQRVTDTFDQLTAMSQNEVERDSYNSIKDQLLSVIKMYKEVASDTAGNSTTVFRTRRQATNRLMRLTSQMTSPQLSSKTSTDFATKLITEGEVRNKMIESCNSLNNRLVVGKDDLSDLKKLQNFVYIAARQFKDPKGYKKVACGLSAFSLEQIYDELMYGLGWLDVVHEVENMTLSGVSNGMFSCEVMVGDLMEGVRDVKAIFSSTEGRDIADCLVKEENVKILNSLDRYLDVASSMKRLLGSVNPTDVTAKFKMLEPTLRAAISAVDKQLIVPIKLSDYVDSDTEFNAKVSTLDSCLKEVILVGKFDGNIAAGLATATDYLSFLCATSNRIVAIESHKATTCDIRSAMCPVDLTSQSYRNLESFSVYLHEKFNQHQLKQDLPKMKESRVFNTGVLEHMIEDSNVLAAFLQVFDGVQLDTDTVISIATISSDLLYGQSMSEVKDAANHMTRTLQSLFSGDNEAIESINNGINSFDVVMNVTLAALDQPYNMQTLFLNQSSFVTILEEYGFSTALANLIFDQAVVKMSSVLQRVNNTNFQSTFCQPTELQDVLLNVSVHIPEISTIFCRMDPILGKRFFYDLLWEMNVGQFLQQFMQSAVSKQFESKGLSTDRANSVLAAILESSKIFPDLLDVFSEPEQPHTRRRRSATEKPIGSSINTFDLGTIGRMMCDSSRMSMLESVHLDTKDVLMRVPNEDDVIELENLPNEQCRNIYMSITSLPYYGHAIWKYLKTWLQGRIAVVPDTPETRILAKEANETFREIGVWMQIFQTGAEAGSSFGDLVRDTEKYNLIKGALSRKTTQSFMKTLLGLEVDNLLESMEKVESINWDQMEQLKQLSGMMSEIGACLSLDRFIFFDNEQAMQSKASELIKDSNFLAAVIFDDFLPSTERTKRMIIDTKSEQNQIIPKKINYKIRMDISNSPPTDQLFVDVLNFNPQQLYGMNEYQLGFIQVQDMFDQAIIRLQVEQTQAEDIPINMYYQRFPRPCKNDDFANNLHLFYPAVMVIACMVFMIIRLRDLVLENPPLILQLMRVMGLKRGVRWLGWFQVGLVSVVIEAIALMLMLHYGHILPFASRGILFLSVVNYGISMIALSYLIGSFFVRTTQATLTGVIVYFLSLLPFLVVNMAKSFGYSTVSRVFTSLFAPSAFGYANYHIAVWERQGSGINWENMRKSPVYGESLAFSHYSVIIMIDSVLYFILGWYFTNVLSSQSSATGVRRFLFFLYPSYWINGTSVRTSMETLESKYKLQSTTDKYAIVEPEQSHTKSGISLNHLSKQYKNTASSAVTDLSINFYENEVTGFLGHNGAGKTTTINMLCGVMPPTSGDAIVDGRSVVNQFNEVRKTLGVCFQQNVLFDDLSVRDHLEFYGALKGTFGSSSKLAVEIERILDETWLVDRQNELAGTLSGGLKRRLCVAIAFLCGSKVVILDEPTAGIDPVARRHIWTIVERLKKGRTVLLCTHYLDEAEGICDRVSILNQGKLLCSGSMPFLKDHFGTGYKLVITQTVQTAAKRITDDVVMKTLIGAIAEYVPDCQVVDTEGRKVIIALPRSSQVALDKLLTSLNKNKDELGIANYNLLDSTLEEAFMVVSELAKEDSQLIVDMPERWKMLKSAKSTSKISNEHETSFSVDFEKTIVPEPTETNCTGIVLKMQQFGSLLYKRFTHARRDWRMLISGLLLPLIFVSAAMGFNLIRPSPMQFVPLTVGPQLYGPQQSLFYGSDHYRTEVMNDLDISFLRTPGLMNDHCSMRNQNCNPKTYFTTEYQDDNQESGIVRRCLCRKEINAYCSAATRMQKLPRLGLVNGSYLYDASNYEEEGMDMYLVSTYQKFMNDRFGGWSFGHEEQNEQFPPYIRTFYSYNTLHGIPSYYSVASNAALKAKLNRHGGSGSDGYAISTTNLPLKVDAARLNQRNLIQKVTDLGIALVFLCAYSFIPCSLIIYLVQERVSKEKQLQMLSDVGPILYWLCSLVWDMSFYMISVALGVLVMGAFKLPIYTSAGNFQATVMLLTLYGWSCLPMMYLLQRKFRDATVAYMILFCLCVFIGVNTLFCVMLLSIFSWTLGFGAAYNMVRYTFLIFPQFCMSGGLIELATNELQAQMTLQVGGESTYKDPFGFDVVGWHLLSMVIQGIVYMTVNILIEMKCHHVDCLPSFNEDERAVMEADDVRKERSDVMNCDVGTSSYLLRVVGLKKEYRSLHRSKLAVRDLTFGVKRGECFALLGLNGAGKTTTFQMLTAGTKPTEGEAFLLEKCLTGVNIGMNSVGGQLGYCPQEDACDLYLTGREVLQFYARLKGFSGKNLTQMVDVALDQVELMQHADKLVKTYSGGTKRKLSTAVALIGRPLVVLMDEPTSGMDVVSKRLVWNNINSVLRDGRAVILTSHSMEECEALCSRMGILVNGELQCIGSVNDLKNRFARGFTLKIQTDEMTNVESIVKYFSDHLNDVLLKDHHKNVIEFTVFENEQTDNSQLENIFRVLNDAKRESIIGDFTLTENSLDQVYVNFSKNQSDESIKPEAINV